MDVWNWKLAVLSDSLIDFLYDFSDVLSSYLKALKELHFSWFLGTIKERLLSWLCRIEICNEERCYAPISFSRMRSNPRLGFLLACGRKLLFHALLSNQRYAIARENGDLLSTAVPSSNSFASLCRILSDFSFLGRRAFCSYAVEQFSDDEYECDYDNHKVFPNLKLTMLIFCLSVFSLYASAVLIHIGSSRYMYNRCLKLFTRSSVVYLFRRNSGEQKKTSCWWRTKVKRMKLQLQSLWFSLS